MRLGSFRVALDTTDNGYTLNCSFALFIEEYPFSKQLPDYGQLNLGQLVLGSLVNKEGGLYKV